MNFILENATSAPLIIPGVELRRVKTNLCKETDEWLTIIHIPDMPTLATFLHALGQHTIKIYSAPHRWGPHWPPELWLMFIEVDDALGRQNVEVIDNEA